MLEFGLPDHLGVGCVQYQINADWRNIYKVCAAFQDSELNEQEKVYVCLKLIYKKDLDQISNIEEALNQSCIFLNGSNDSFNGSASKNLNLVFWDSDFPLIIAPINRLAGTDIRSLKFLHWWTFLSYFQEIGECTFSTIINLRRKLRLNKKLEKYEKEFIKENFHLINPQISRKQEIKRHNQFRKSWIDVLEQKAGDTIGS
jgi:hypothetical protein